jgi:hypothetical protein
MKKTGLLAAVIALGSLTGVAQASPVVENVNPSKVSDIQSVPITLLLFVGSSTFVEGNDVVPVTGQGTVYDIIPTENGYYIKGLSSGVGYIKINGMKKMVEVVNYHPGPDFLK